VDLEPDTLYNAWGSPVNPEGYILPPPEVTERLERIERQLAALIGLMGGESTE
jgi:hypothetical protein